MFLFLSVFITPDAHTFPADSSSVYQLKPGAIELGLSGSLAVIEGLTDAAVLIRTGALFNGPAALGEIELGFGYSHVRSLDVVDIQVHLAGQRRISGSSVYPFVALGGGMRQEWLGSFRQVRYPLGLVLGTKFLITGVAGLRIEYKFQRVLHDPISNFSEHRIMLGMSFFLKNSRSHSDEGAQQ